jgi:hypothetical protein
MEEIAKRLEVEQENSRSNTPNSRREGNSAFFSGSYKGGLTRYKTPVEKPL